MRLGFDPAGGGREFCVILSRVNLTVHVVSHMCGTHFPSKDTGILHIVHNGNVPTYNVGK